MSPLKNNTVELLPPITYTVLIGDKVKVTEDKKSRSRITNFPFEFPDGTRGVVIVCRIKDEPWKPNEDISSVTLTFKPHEN